MKNILMNTEMTKVILDGRKTQTRRVITARIRDLNNGFFNINMSDEDYVIVGVELEREEVKDFILENKEPEYQIDEIIEIAKTTEFNIDIFLKVTDIRVERLQDITIEDCYDEGIDPFDVMEMLDGTEFKEFVVFEKIWNKTAPKGYKWSDNPYVFVYEFERVENDNKLSKK